MNAIEGCGHDLFDVDNHLAQHPRLKAEFTRRSRHGETPKQRWIAMLIAYRRMREESGMGLTSAELGACALLRRHPVTGHDMTCTTAGVIWEMAKQEQDLPAPKRAEKQYYQAPLECLPPLLGQFVDTVAGAVQIPPEMALMAALTSVSFATGGKLVVAINTQHFEPLTLWALVTAAPSERKSGALEAAARKPLSAAVAQYWEDHEDEQTKLADKVEITEARIKGYKADVAKAREQEEREEAQGNLDMEREYLKALLEQVIHRPVWAITDATPEGLEEVMATTGGPAASFNDEAALLSTIAGRYSRGAANTASLNQAHSQGNIHVIRRGSERVVDEPHLVMCQIIQPEPFAQLMGALRVKADGFLSRWLYADPAPYGSRMARGGDIDTSVVNQWTKTLRMLLDRCWAQKTVTSIHLTEESWAIYEEMFDQIDADVQAHATTDGTYSQWLGKAANAHMVRIAAMFELIDDPSSEMISGDSMRRAAILYGWLRDEARKAMTTTSGDEILPEVERKALEYIAGQRAKDYAGMKDVMEFVAARDLKRGVRKFRDMEREEIEAVLMQLEDAGWLSRTDSAGRTDAQTRWKVRWDFEAVWKP